MNAISEKHNEKLLSDYLKAPRWLPAVYIGVALIGLVTGFYFLEDAVAPAVILLLSALLLGCAFEKLVARKVIDLLIQEQAKKQGN
ncbi:MAG: hypothetical protein R3208_17640 [Ketobacteraceae bacterium]|nr:hypothetical protein [Ketobacteraceae bacterium]